MDQTSHLTFGTAGLFTPGRLGPYTLPHRLLMAPMTRNRAQRDGVRPHLRPFTMRNVQAPP